MKQLSCENPGCKNLFLRYPKDISVHNYCSRSCAIVVNNKLFPKRKVRIHFCEICGNEIKGSIALKFCSVECKSLAQRKYSKQEVIEAIIEIASVLRRTPSRRELGILSDGAIRIFGTWDTAIRAASLTPNRSANQRMYKRTRTTAFDGHRCDSISEAIIDNWLVDKGIVHERDARYPHTKHKADWVIGNGIFIEYFGLINDNGRYDQEIRKKRHLCKENSIKLIEIYPSDLYPRKRLEEKLETFSRISKK